MQPLNYCQLPKLFYFISFFLSLLFSCSSRQEDYHPEYFNPAFKRFDTILLKTERDIQQLDAVFNAFGRAGIGDRLEKYQRQYDFYFHTQRDYTKALNLADSIILVTATRTRDKHFAHLYANGFFLKGDVYKEIVDYDRALQNYTIGKQALAASQEDNCAIIDYTYRIATIIYEQERFLLAANYYQQVVNDIINCRPESFEKFAALQENLDNLALSYYRGGRADSAELYFNKAIDYINSNEHLYIDKKNYTELAKGVVYGNLGELLGHQKRFEEAEQYVLKSADIIKRQDPFSMYEKKLVLAEIYIDWNKPKDADALLTEVKPLVDSFPDDWIAQEYYRERAKYYSHTNNFAKAFGHLEKYLAMKDSVYFRYKYFDAMNTGTELEKREQKHLIDLLEKDNELKKAYLLVAVAIALLVLTILGLVWYNLKRKAKYVQNLEMLNKMISLKNDDLQKAFVSLEQSHNENNRLLRIAAHDMRNPLSVIQNLATLLLRKENIESNKQSLSLIAEASSSSLNLIKELLENKEQNDKMQNELTDMRALVQYCVNMLQSKADEKKQLLVFDAEEVMIKINRQKIWRVISNIITNAIKFSPEDSVINIALKKSVQTILLTVKDQGIGIPEELREKIFTLTPETQRKGTSGEESYGLGLSIAKKIISEYRGRIWFERNEEKGTSFYIEIPV